MREEAEKEEEEWKILFDIVKILMMALSSRHKMLPHPRALLRKENDDDL